MAHDLTQRAQEIVSEALASLVRDGHIEPSQQAAVGMAMIDVFVSAGRLAAAE